MTDAKRAPRGTETPDPTRLRFTLGASQVDYNLANEVSIDGDNLSTALLEQPSKFAWIAMCHQAYKAAAEASKTELDQMSARLYGAIRDSASPGEKLTEAAVDAKIKLTPKYIQAQQNLQELRKLEGQLSVAVEAFRHRKDMLISASALHRAELDMDLSRLKSDYVSQLKGGK